MLSTLFGKRIWDRRRSIVWWLLGIAAMVLLTVAFYPTIRDQQEEYERIFGRNIEAIRSFATGHALAKDKAFVRKLSGEASTRMPRWSQAELDILREEYPTQPNLELAQKLDRSVTSVVSKAHNMGLKKSSERLREMGRENVSLRYQSGD
jgi:hypothetical protein